MRLGLGAGGGAVFGVGISPGVLGPPLPTERGLASGEGTPLPGV